MAVTNAETFKMHGGSLNSGTSDSHLSAIARLAEVGVTATYSGGVLTITNAGLATTKLGGVSLNIWSEVLAVAAALDADFVYVAAS